MSMDPRTMIASDVKPSATRKSFGAALKELGDRDPKVVVLDADLSKSTMSLNFAEAHPQRFFVIVMGISPKNRGAGIIVGDPHYSRGNSIRSLARRKSG